jgi:hypothetical protein
VRRRDETEFVRREWVSSQSESPRRRAGAAVSARHSSGSLVRHQANTNPRRGRSGWPGARPSLRDSTVRRRVVRQRHLTPPERSGAGPAALRSRGGRSRSLQRRARTDANSHVHRQSQDSMGTRRECLTAVFTAAAEAQQGRITVRVTGRRNAAADRAGTGADRGHDQGALTGGRRPRLIRGVVPQVSRYACFASATRSRRSRSPSWPMRKRPSISRWGGSGQPAPVVTTLRANSVASRSATRSRRSMREGRRRGTVRSVDDLINSRTGWAWPVQTGTQTGTGSRVRIRGRTRSICRTIRST